MLMVQWSKIDSVNWTDENVAMNVKDSIEETFKKVYEDSSEMIPHDKDSHILALMQLDNDLDYILTAKSEGEAATKIRQSKSGGWDAYFRLHRWFTSITWGASARGTEEGDVPHDYR